MGKKRTLNSLIFHSSVYKKLHVSLQRCISLLWDEKPEFRLVPSGPSCGDKQTGSESRSSHQNIPLSVVYPSTLS